MKKIRICVIPKSPEISDSNFGYGQPAVDCRLIRDLLFFVVGFQVFVKGSFDDIVYIAFR